jgi:hypothetical protein
MSRTNWDNPLHWRKSHAHMAQAPQTVRINLIKPNGKRGNSQFIMPADWQEFIRSKNTDRAWHYLTHTASGWVNRPPWPTVQALLFRDNVIPILRIDGNKAFIAHYDISQPPPAPKDERWAQRFTVIREDGVTIYPDPPRDIAWMPLAFPGDAWIDAAEIEPWTR